MNKLLSRIGIVFLLFIGLHFPASAQIETVLAPGNPPLTRSMLTKAIGIFEWSLEIRFNDDQRSRIERTITGYWQSNKRSEVDTIVELANMADGLLNATADVRRKTKDMISTAITQGLRNEPDDEISRVVKEALQSRQSPGNNADRASNNLVPSVNTQRVGADGFSGIYVGTRNFASAINSVQLDYVTFLPTGNVYWTLPIEGLLHFEPLVARRAGPDEWGTYKLAGDKVEVTVGNGLRYLFVKEGVSLKLQPHAGSSGVRTYSPLAAADGLKLSGTYRRYPQAPGITFSKDGRFRDDGFTRDFGTMAKPDGTTYQDDGRGGTGTYTIEQYTLELRYSDGRVKRFAFTVSPATLSREPIRTFKINYETFQIE